MDKLSLVHEKYDRGTPRLLRKDAEKSIVPFQNKTGEFRKLTENCFNHYRGVIARKDVKIEGLVKRVKQMEEKKVRLFARLHIDRMMNVRCLLASFSSNAHILISSQHWKNNVLYSQNNVAAQCNGEAAKKSDQLEKKVEKSYTIRLSAEPPAPESAKERIQEWIDDLSGKLVVTSVVEGNLR